MKTKCLTLSYRSVLKSFCVGMLVLGILISPNLASAKQYTITGKATSVVDGDTFRFLGQDQIIHVIRVWGIDCPEKKQKFGDRATSFLTSLIVEKPLRLLVKSKDKYGRLVCQVFHEDMDIGLTMVRMGFAWHYVSITKNKALANAQAEAKRQQLGLWSDPDPTPPWVYRIPKATGSVMYLREPYKIHFQNG